MPDQNPISNDLLSLIPQMPKAKRWLEYDFPALHIGVAEYAEGPTGCTIFYFPDGATCAADVRGGSPGTFLPGDGWVNALCYAGGSLYGLEATAGVAAELLAMRNYSGQWFDIGIVRGAIIYDYGPRDNTIYPDKALGRAALRSATPGIFPMGPHGAGCSATTGKGFEYIQGERAGQGGAFRQVGPTKVAVFTVVNALGAIVNREREVVRGYRDRETGKRLFMTEILERKIASGDAPQTVPGNTTLSVVVTNQKLNSRELSQMARQVHASMSRAIQPFHCLEDGDVLYAITTNEVENPTLPLTALSILASELAWDAVLTSFEE